MDIETSASRTILGMPAEVYELAASQYSKSAIFIWCVAGLIFISVSSDYRIMSIPTAALFVPGIFIASLASMPLFVLSVKIKRVVAAVNSYRKINAVVVLGGCTAALALFRVVQVVMPIYFVKLCAWLL